jgi:hypothetical protein
VNSLQHQLQVTRVEPHRSFTFENNVIYWTNQSPTYAGPWHTNQHVTGNNLYWNPNQTPKFANKTLAEWQATGREQGTAIADPQFVDPAKRDFRFKADSAALKMGFQPFDYTKAGVYGEAAWLAKARNATYPAMQPPPEPSRLPISENFERTPAGQKPKGFGLVVDNKGDSILVTEESAAPGGKRSVKVTDAPGLTDVWKPHLYLQTNFEKGVVRNRFDLRIDALSNVTFEWRDWSAAEYYTGPRIDLRDGKLSAGGQTVEVPLNEWLHLEVSADVTNGGSGKWNLALTPAGQPKREFKDLPHSSNKFKKLTWIGFTSNANTNTSYYLDNFAVENQ